MKNNIENNDENRVFHSPPHPLLSDFISHYTFRRILIPPNTYLEKAMPLRLINSIDFFIGDDFETMDCSTGKIIPFVRCTIRGLRTSKKYLIRLHGLFISFTVKFHSTGMYQLLKMPMHIFRDKAISGSDLNILPFENITSQLLYANDINTCISIVEPYLIKLSLGCLPVTGITSQAAELLKGQKGNTSIYHLAQESNLSLRQLERNFRKEIGVTPKTYARMLRFQQLLQNKITSPHEKWGILAYENDYFDQMHLVKEFKQFLGTTPSGFHSGDYAF